jgi:hypothetical protein
MGRIRDKLSLAVVQGKRGGSWVQTERAAHERWAELSSEYPRASSVLHVIVAHMEQGSNALVASHALLAARCACSVATLKRALAVLAGRRWIQIVQIGPSGSVNAYVVNSRVAWSGSRKGLRQAAFSATVLAAEHEQPSRVFIDDGIMLNQLPALWPGERQLPSGPGLPPPSEPSLPGLEPDLPALPHPRSAQTEE